MKNKHVVHYDKISEIANLIGIKLAPVEQMLSVYPDEFKGIEFSDELDEKSEGARKKYSQKMQAALIKGFRSHDWLVYSDIYGHNGLSQGGSCKKCGRKFKFPEPDVERQVSEKPSKDKQDWRRRFKNVSEDFILAYHLIYGAHEKFGGRVTRCKGKK
jgi:hypothetical protein